MQTSCTSQLTQAICAATSQKFLLTSTEIAKNTKKRFRIIYEYLASKSQSCIHTTATCLRYILKVESSKPELTNQDRDKMFRSLQYTIAGMVCSFSILLPQNSSLMQNVLPHYSSNEVGIFLSRLGGLGSFIEFLINPVLGRLGDSIGRKPILLVALSSNFLFAFVCNIK